MVRKGDQAPNQGRRFPAEPLTAAEVGLLLAQCSRRAPTGIRNRAMIVIMYHTGLRISEVLDLKVSDIDVIIGSVRVLHGKGNKARTVGLDDDGLIAVQRWMDTRKALGIRNGKLFCTLAGGPVSDRYVRDMMKRLASKAGVEKRVHPHALRHSNAVEMQNQGATVSVISRHLGHSSSAVTARYLDHVSPADVITAGRGMKWKV